MTMGIPKKFVLLFLYINIFQQTFGQSTNFEKGYQEGLKNGYCYNVKSISCWYPVPFVFPQPRMNENYTSYKDGYNRGFQIGLDFQRIDNNNPNIDYYDNLQKQIPT